MIFKKRNLSSAIEAVNVTTQDAIWNDWTIENAVKDGYKVSSWVYKSVSLISRNASSVPLVVKNKDGQIEWEHPLTKLLINPHPFINRMRFYEILVQWLQLSGNAYIKRADGSRSTKELWLISPDRIAPIESEDNTTFLEGYKIKNKAGAYVRDEDNFNRENIIHIALTDPSQPLLGISPLQACARSVDTDIAQQTWNTSAMQNKGVVDGVFTFKSQLSKDQTDNIIKRIMDRFSGVNNARKPLVIGSDASYTRLSLTQAEMDFIESRNFNRDEIFIVFGIPPQLGGSQESATYNNFAESMRIFWMTTIIPLVDLIAEQLTVSFADQLDNGRYIDADYSDVEALKDNEKEKAETAKIYSDMGVPFEQINEKFELGFSKFEGWDKTNTISPQLDNNLKDEKKDEVKRGLVLLPLEKRNVKKEADLRDKIAEKKVKPIYEDFFKRQANDVFNALERNEDPRDVIKKYDNELANIIKDVTVGVASQFVETISMVRGKKLDWQRRSELEDELIDEFLREEFYILKERSLIQDQTIGIILEQVKNAGEMGYNYNDLRKAIGDTGIFSPERALRIARTEVATSASIGQVASATVAGATHKIWNISGNNTRPQHSSRDGETVRLNETFSEQGYGVRPRFPSDPRSDVSDRVNCNCFLQFDIED